MKEKLRGIVLNSLKWNERHKIVHIYTDQRGLMGFIVPDSSTSSARMRNAMLMPMSLVEFEANIMPNRDLSTFHDLRRSHALANVYSDPVKSAIAMFISELLTHCIQERERNDALYLYIESSVRLLEQAGRGVANFHICFLYHLGAFIGIEPDMGTYGNGYWFDLREGVFVPSAPQGRPALDPERARVLHTLSRITFGNMHLFRFNRDQRNEMLDVILTYYRLHNSTLGTLRSPAVLKQLLY